jgi:hypothetical protein
MWNEEEFKKGAAPEFGAFPTHELPLRKIRFEGMYYQQELIKEIGFPALRTLADSGKCPAGVIFFLHAVTGIRMKGKNTTMLMKSFNFTPFSENVGKEYIDFMHQLNAAMHRVSESN